MLLGAIGLVVAFAMRRQGGPHFDDPYILFRYAENLGRQGRWEFNPYSASENAVTSTLYVLVLATFNFVGISVTWAASAVFFVTTSTAAALTGLALHRCGRDKAGVLSAFLIASSPVLTAFQGMESSLFLFLLSATLYRFVTRKSMRTTGLLLGLLILTRPDGFVIGAVLVIVFFLVNKDRLQKQYGFSLLLGAAIPVGIFATFALATFGNPFPSTLAAKIAQGKSGYWPSYVHGAYGTITDLMKGSPETVKSFIWILGAAAIIGTAATIFRRSGQQVVLALFVATSGLVFFYDRVVSIPAYPWYYALPMYTLLILASLGADFLISLAPLSKLHRTLFAATIVVVSVVAGLRLTSTSPANFRAEYAIAGQWLRDNTPSQSTVAAMEIGKIGWYSDRDMIDYLGLLDSAANKHVAQSDFLWWPSHYQPDYWVTQGLFIDAPFFTSRCFYLSFQPAFRTNSLTVFRRIAVIPPPSAC